MVKLTKALVLGRTRASELENVRKLNVWGSGITDVSILRNLKTVQIISLSVNKISTLADFAHCENLEELYIRKNEIDDLSEICHLKELPKLRILWLADNPCATGDKYRLTVLKTLPNLQKLDNTSVQEDELNLAIEQGLEVAPPGEATVNNNNVDVKEEKPNHNHVISDKGDHNSDTEVVKEEDQSQNEETMEDSSEQASDSVAETNQIRQQLGLKPLSVEKLVPARPKCSSSAKARNANLLQAALCLVKELDPESLEILSDAVRNRIDSFDVDL